MTKPNPKPVSLCQMTDTQRETYLREFFAAERRDAAARDIARRQAQRVSALAWAGMLAGFLICAALGLGLGFAALAWAGFKP